MSTLIISDVHIGDPKSGVKDLHFFLDQQKDVDELIIAGDFVDLWLAGIDDILQEASTIMYYIKSRFKDKFTWIVGNHDIDLEPLFCSSKIIEVNNKRVLIVHGHQYDESFYLAYMDFIARWIAMGIATINSYTTYDLRRYMLSLSKFMDIDSYEDMIHDVKYTANEKIGGRYDCVIMGHTHKAEIQTLDSGLIYMNCGDWVQHRTAIKLNDSGEFSLIDIKGKVLDTIIV
jgi:UDP-2,3-diacylglucosamine pyrophosphatase LpxH